MKQEERRKRHEIAVSHVARSRMRRSSREVKQKGREAGGEGGGRETGQMEGGRGKKSLLAMSLKVEKEEKK